jgi:hypothetical protein
MKKIVKIVNYHSGRRSEVMVANWHVAIRWGATMLLKNHLGNLGDILKNV